jgi:hypothetical protein
MPLLPRAILAGHAASAGPISSCDGAHLVGEEHAIFRVAASCDESPAFVIALAYS